MVIARLFRDPRDAEKAVKELKAKGYSEKGIGLLALNKEGKKPFKGKVMSLDIGSVIAAGPIATLLAETGSDGLAAVLSKLEISEEKSDYYEFGISTGGVLISVAIEEAQAQQAEQILREADSAPQKGERWANSPGFAIASRMAATDSVDAPMSGDFRKY